MYIRIRKNIRIKMKEKLEYMKYLKNLWVGNFFVI